MRISDLCCWIHEVVKAFYSLIWFNKLKSSMRAVKVTEYLNKLNIIITLRCIGFILSDT